MKIEDVLVPPRTTAFCQPADLMWIRELKKKYHAKWSSWWLSDTKAFTKAGNLKSPGYVRAMRWFIEAWNELDVEIIKSSFELTGITCSNRENFNSVLRHVLENADLPGKILDDVHESDELAGFGEDLDVQDTGEDLVSEENGDGSDSGDDTDSDESTDSGESMDSDEDSQSDDSDKDTVGGESDSETDQDDEDDEDIDTDENYIDGNRPTTSKKAILQKSD